MTTVEILIQNCGKLIQVREGEGLDFAKNILSQILSEVKGGVNRKPCAANSSKHHNKGENNHVHAGVPDVGHI